MKICTGHDRSIRNIQQLLLLALAFFLPLQVMGGQKTSKQDDQDISGSEDTIRPVQEADGKRKIRVVVITNDNGGGHNSAAGSVEASLGDEYEVIKLNLLKDKLPGDKGFMEKFKDEKWGRVKFMQSFMPVVDYSVRRFLKNYIHEELKKQRPDAIVSVFPIGNSAYQKAAKKLNVPFFIIPTDLSYGIFLRNFNRKKNAKNSVGQNTILCAAYDELVEEIDKSKTNLASNTIVTGYPIRPAFADMAKKIRAEDPVTMAELDQLRREFDIRPDDKVVFVSLGAMGMGQKAILSYIDAAHESIELLTEGNPSRRIHFIVATGTNKELFDTLLDKMKVLEEKNSRVKISPRQWIVPEEFAKILAISDVPIIKPGGSTVAEALAIGKPILFKSDSTRAMVWEKRNMDFVVENNWGIPLAYFHKSKKFDKKDFLSKLSQLFANGENISKDIKRSKQLPPINEFPALFKMAMDKVVKKSSSTDDPNKNASTIILDSAVQSVTGLTQSRDIKHVLKQGQKTAKSSPSTELQIKLHELRKDSRKDQELALDPEIKEKIEEEEEEEEEDDDE